ncbi:MAG: AAA family ATPase [Chloroflexota bacterium]|nr:AAA family ATPase [Chloroflexota bacterium]
MTLHLRTITLDRKLQLPSVFPFTVPLIANHTVLELTTPVTLFVGENGSGKSTLLEAIAIAARMVTVGSRDAHRDETLVPLRVLADRLKLSWHKQTKRGFFMRAEDFFGFAKRISQMQQEMRDDLLAVDREYMGRSETAKALAKMSHAGQLHALQQSYGEGLDSASHGESFFALFRSRFVPGGLYVLDEPEAPLSPSRQLAFLAMLHQMVGQDAQFLIATHSPILLAYPGATIYSCDGGVLRQMKYDELEHVTLTRDFLNNPAAYLRQLLDTA